METKVLLHVDDQQVMRLTEEIKIRQRLLNELIDAGIRSDEIPNVISQEFVDDTLFQRHLQLNRSLASEYSAGKRQKHLVEAYVLPRELELLETTMKNWLNYPVPHRGFDKFRHLHLIDGAYQLNQETIEQELTVNKFKIYGDDRIVAEVKKLESHIDYLIEKDANSHQILGCGFWGARLVCDASLSCNQLPQRRFMIKRSYLLGLMDQGTV